MLKVIYQRKSISYKDGEGDKTNKFLLTFEYNDEDGKIEVHADEQGLRHLKEQLEKLLEKPNHIHMMTPDWGGDELSNEKQGKNNKLINHVKIFHWED